MTQEIEAKLEKCESCEYVGVDVTREVTVDKEGKRKEGNLLCPICYADGKAVKERLKNHSVPATLTDVKATFQKWLYLDGDTEVIDVFLACSIDRLLPGDPIWLLFISPSGGSKTEIVRSNTTSLAYTLDSLTAHTLVSGKMQRNAEGTQEPVTGILKEIDGKVLIIKDLTVILTKRQEERDEIFSQLRCLYDGYLEYGFGTLDKPIRIPASIGLVAAVTPSVDQYSKMYVQLGERFLKIRHSPDGEKATAKAMSNLGKEEEMRLDLSSVVDRFLRLLPRNKIENASEQQLRYIQKLAHATAILRTPVSINFWRYEVNSALTPNVEYPTRLSKQLLKLTYALAMVRGKTVVDSYDLKTVQRVARDTTYPNRIRILKAMKDKNESYSTRQVADLSDIPLSSCWRELKELEYLNVVKYEKYEEYANTYANSKRHEPEKDGWQLRNETLNVLWIDLPETILSKSVSLNPSEANM